MKILRSDILELKEPSAEDFFNSKAGESDEIEYPEWDQTIEREIMLFSPRAFWLMAKGNVIPTQEIDALAMIQREGLRIPSKDPPVANVVRLDATKSKALMLILLASDAPRGFVPVPPPPRVSRI